MSYQGSDDEVTTFNFASLPWVCQKRFAEVCDPGTLKTFASLNSFTRSLAKRCHFVNYAAIEDDRPAYYRISCFCHPKEHCDGWDLGHLKLVKSKLEVMNTVDIWVSNENISVDDRFFHGLPISLSSNQCLRLKVRHIEFTILRSLLTPNLRRFQFYGCICFGHFAREAVTFIEQLSKLDDFTLEMFPSFHDSEVDDFISDVMSLLFRRVTVLVVGSKVLLKKRFIKSSK